MSTPLAGAGHEASWRPLAAVLVSALLTVFGVDLLVGRVAPLPAPIPEVEEGLADYENSDPETLVLGSSHARSFGSVADVVAERTAGAHRIVIIPEEGGTFYAFNWVLQHRVRPLMEERDANGRLVRNRLKRVLLVTTYWDMCPAHYTNIAGNIPARAWTFQDFVDDAASHGITDFNRNYLLSRWKRLFPWSAFVQGREEERLRRAIQGVRKGPEERAREEERKRQSRIRTRFREIQEEYAVCDDATQKRSLDETIDYLAGRSLDVTVVLFPLAEETLSETAKQTTLKRYSDYVAALGRARSFRVADLTLTAPLEGPDFEWDMDHVKPAGNRKFAPWALDHGLSFLLEPAAAGGVGAASR